MDTSGPNAEQITYWNDTAGPKWVALEEMLDQQIQPLGSAVMDALDIRAGERVLDVGCGTGQTSLELGRRVGPSGRVLGVDLSAPMLARARARTSDVAHVAFVQADAQAHRFEAVDVCFSRFGVMFFADPVAAFANLRTAIRPDGRLGFVCWQALPENPWMAVPVMALASHVTLPVPASPDAPGPFAFAAAGRVRDILSRAGFDGVSVADHRVTLTVGGTGGLDQAVDLMMQMGPASRALQDADPALRVRAAAAIREAIAPYHSSAGVRMGGAAWIVTAHRS